MLLVGTRFAIVNTEEEADPPADRLVLRLVPSHSAGHGWSPDTAAHLRALERQVRPGDAVLDVGAGVGTLALAALLLGAASATAAERDPDALDALRANAEANGVGDRLAVYEGTVPDGTFDLVVCNLGLWAATEPHVGAIHRATGRALILTVDEAASAEAEAHARADGLARRRVARVENPHAVAYPGSPHWSVLELTR